MSTPIAPPELNAEWLELSKAEHMHWAAEADKLKSKFDVQMSQWRKSGGYFKASRAESQVPPTVSTRQPTEIGDEHIPVISAEQLEPLIDTFASKCAAEYNLDDNIVRQFFVGFKRHFQRPDTEAPSYSKVEFQRVLDKLASKLIGALPASSKEVT